MGFFRPYRTVYRLNCFLISYFQGAELKHTDYEFSENSHFLISTIFKALIIFSGGPHAFYYHSYAIEGVDALSSHAPP